MRSAAVVTAPPLTGDYWTNTFETDEAPRRVGEACFQSISADYFRAMEVPILAGRPLVPADTDQSAAVALVNQAFARKYWPRGNAIGKAIVVSRTSVEHAASGVNMVNRPQRVEIVGVVGSLNQLGLDAPSQPEIVMPYTQRASDAMAIVLRATSGVQPTALAAAAREELRHLDVDLPITDVKTMDEWIRRGTSQSRFVLVLVTLFGLVATVLAACGIFGVVAHSVSRRTQEIAIRLALGARPTGVVARIAGQHLWCVLAGVAVGIVGALGATRLLTAYLFGVQRTDTTTYAAAAVLLFLVALTAAVVPAARAARIQPAIILKAE